MRVTRQLSILSLAGWVVVAALGFAALRSGSDNWTGATVLAAWSILTLTVIGALCRRGVERAWWLGFSAFGWGYLALLHAGYILPTEFLLRLLGWLIRPPDPARPAPPAPSFAGMGWLLGPYPSFAPPRYLAAHQMCALTVATLGGWAASLFGGRADGTSEGRAGWDARRAALLGSAAFTGFVVLILPGLRWVPGLTAGLVLAVTCAVLGLAALGGVCNAGVRRASCLGAAAFGLGVLVMVVGPETVVGYWPRVVASRLLDAAEDWLPSPLVREANAISDPNGRSNRRIRDALDRPGSLHFPDDVKLGTFLKEFQAQLRRDGEPPVPVYVDPQGLMDADKTEDSPLRIDLEGVRLGTCLMFALDQLSMTYLIIDGVLVITCHIDDEDGLPALASRRSMVVAPPLRVVGGCLLSLFAALVGGLLGPLVVAAPTTGSDRPAPGA